MLFDWSAIRLRSRGFKRWLVLHNSTLHTPKGARSRKTKYSFISKRCGKNWKKEKSIYSEQQQTNEPWYNSVGRSRHWGALRYKAEVSEVEAVENWGGGIGSSNARFGSIEEAVIIDSVVAECTGGGGGGGECWETSILGGWRESSTNNFVNIPKKKQI